MFLAARRKACWCRNNWQVLCEYNGASSFQQWFAYGNYIDEVLFTSASTLPTGYKYYVHDHLYSPVAFVSWSGGTVLERYEYDAYGNCHVLEANFGDDPDGLTDYSNPYLFSGRTAADFHVSGDAQGIQQAANVTRLAAHPFDFTRGNRYYRTCSTISVLTEKEQ